MTGAAGAAGVQLRTGCRAAASGAPGGGRGGSSSPALGWLSREKRVTTAIVVGDRLGVGLAGRADKQSGGDQRGGGGRVGWMKEKMQGEVGESGYPL